MKKFLFFVGIAIASMTACTKTEGVLGTPSESVISFKPLAAVQTKSGPITAYVEGTGDFNVYAWYQASDVSAAFNPTESYTLYMNDVTCTYTKVGDIDEGFEGMNTWKPANTYYWPKNGKLTFSAYYPTNTANIDVNAKNGITITDYTISDAANTQVDLLFSDRAYDRVSTTQTDNVKEYDGVDIVFNHALSALTVNVKTADDYAADAIKLKKVEIVDALNKGTFKENCNNGYNNDTHKPEWTLTGDVTTYTVFGLDENGTTVTREGWKAGKDCLVLPQVFSDDIAIKVTYAIKYIDGETTKYLEQTATFPLKNSTTGNNPATAITAWEMGKWYKYNFTFTLDEIYFAPSVDKWDEVIVNPFEVK